MREVYPPAIRGLDRIAKGLEHAPRPCPLTQQLSSPSTVSPMCRFAASSASATRSLLAGLQAVAQDRPRCPVPPSSSGGRQNASTPTSVATSAASRFASQQRWAHHVPLPAHAPTAAPAPVGPGPPHLHVAVDPDTPIDEALRGVPRSTGRRLSRNAEAIAWYEPPVCSVNCFTPGRVRPTGAPHQGERHAKGFTCWAQLHRHAVLSAGSCRLAPSDLQRPRLLRGEAGASGHHPGTEQVHLSYANVHRPAALFEDLFWR